MDFISPNHSLHIGLPRGINDRIACAPSAEADLARNPWLLFSQTDLSFSLSPPQRDYVTSGLFLV